MKPLWLFAVFVVGVVVLPGMDMAFVAATAILRGARAGLAAVGGLVVGGAVHVAFATAGIALVLSRAPWATTALLLAGSAFLAWLGAMLLYRPGGVVLLSDSSRRAGRLDHGAFGGALLTCLLNPKAYLFTLAVFPQFMRVERGALGLQTLEMGAIVASVQAVIYGGVAIGASRLRTWLVMHPTRLASAARAVGAGFLGVAAWTLLHVWRSL